ncbi:GTPase/DUF3482 domain-containing protein [Thermodesulfobacteriota bacterium]
MQASTVPEFAIIGHPNEGKSAIVSTLAEDDSVRVSPYPGETIVCQTFPVYIDGREIMRFTDTPGFQNPKRILAWMKNYQGPDEVILRTFLDTHRDNPDFKEDCELFKPIFRGAGIIYVVDGSRPVRKVDLSEMEILRLLACPRMAIINCKEDETGHLDQWENEFRKHFNANRMFNANRATYAERIVLLENLKGIDQDWEPALEIVISAFKEDWQQRNALTAEIICNMIEDCLSYKISKKLTDKTDEASLKRQIRQVFNLEIEKIEKTAHRKIRKNFKHNVFNYDLPSYSILHEDLFDERTWQVLGLTPKQLITAAGVAGGTIGAALDLAAAGLTFGIFTALGSLAGAGWTALGGGKRLAKAKVVGLSLGGQYLQMGPVENLQFMYVLMDRALIFYSHIINWAHGRRDYPDDESQSDPSLKAGFTYQWDKQTKKACQDFYASIRSGDEQRKMRSRRVLKVLIQKQLLEISHSDKRYGMIPKVKE